MSAAPTFEGKKFDDEVLGAKCRKKMHQIGRYVLQPRLIE